MSIENKKPLISIIIPTYNHALFLKKAMTSVINQTYNNWEAIIVNNYSDDDTVDVVESFKDSRFKLVNFHNNGVIAASRNMGIREAKGEWIAFLDSDDNWYPNKLEVVINEIKETPSIDVCSTDEVLVDEITGEKKLLKYGPYENNFYQKLLLTGNCLSTSAVLVSRYFLNKNNLFFRENNEFVTAEDYDFWMLLAQAEAKFNFIDSVQGEYLIHGGNNSGQLERHNQNIKNVIRDHIYHLQSFETNKDRLWRKINARLLLVDSKNLIVNKNYFSGLHQLFLAFRSSFTGSIRYFVSYIQKKY